MTAPTPAATDIPTPVPVPSPRDARVNASGKHKQSSVEQGQQSDHQPQQQQREPRTGEDEDDHPASTPTDPPPGELDDTPYHYLGHQPPANAGCIINDANLGSAGTAPHSSPVATGRAACATDTDGHAGRAELSQADVRTKEAPGREGNPATGTHLGVSTPIHADSRSQLRDLVLGGPALHRMGASLNAQHHWAQHNTACRTNEALFKLVRKFFYETEANSPPPKADHHQTHKPTTSSYGTSPTATGPGSSRRSTRKANPSCPRTSRPLRPTSCGTSTSLLGSHNCASTSS